MRKIKKIGVLIVIFCLGFYNSCSADLVWIDPGTGEIHGGSGIAKPSKPSIPETSPVNYILIGALVLIIVVCAVIIIRKIIKKKKEKSNDNK